MADPPIKLRKDVKARKVDLDGTIFHTVGLPKSVAVQVEELEGEYFAADANEKIEVLGKLLDIRLTSTNGKAQKPSAIIKRLWNADDLTYDEAVGLYTDINTAGSRPF